MKKQKYYVVWVGVTPGIYGSWTDCQLQTKGYAGARFKSFDTLEEARAAFAAPPPAFAARAVTEKTLIPPPVPPDSLAVDAACSGNPGRMEYRGVHVGSGQVLFHYGPVYGTNNIGEFLAIVHGLAYLAQQGFDWPLYSDSRNALGWVRQRRCKTTLRRDTRTESLFLLISRAEKWLHEHTYTTPLLKWETGLWGEIPADFGRK